MRTRVGGATVAYVRTDLKPSAAGSDNFVGVAAVCAARAGAAAEPTPLAHAVSITAIATPAASDARPRAPISDLR
jgi:hypothetical protein